MSSLSEKIRAARRTKIQCGRYAFIIERPAELDWGKLRGPHQGEAFYQYLCGWEGVTLEDLYPGGGPEPALFDVDDAATWLRDRPDETISIGKGLSELIKQHVAKKASAEGN